MLRTALLLTGIMAITLVAAELDAVRDPAGGLTAVYDVRLADGVTVLAGDTVYDDDVVEIGIVRNDGDEPIVMLDAAGNEIEIPPGGVLQTRCIDCCSVEGCRAGTYACCY